MRCIIFSFGKSGIFGNSFPWLGGTCPKSNALPLLGSICGRTMIQFLVEVQEITFLWALKKKLFLTTEKIGEKCDRKKNKRPTTEQTAENYVCTWRAPKNWGNFPRKNFLRKFRCPSPGSVFKVGPSTSTFEWLNLHQSIVHPSVFKSCESWIWNLLELELKIQAKMDWMWKVSSRGRWRGRGWRGLWRRV